MNTKGIFRWLSIWVLIGLLVALAGPAAAVQAVAQPSAPAFLAASVSFDCSTVVGISITECQALAALYANTQGNQWTNNTGWLVNATPCNWFGVTCISGHVMELYLPYNNLTGPLPAQIGGLTWLTSLVLRSNHISGPLPPEVGSMANLEVLYLATNQISGPIPPQVGSLSHLKYFVLQENQLNGSIPPEFGQMTSLQAALLASNQLSGSLPAEIGNLVHLQILNLSTNQFSGDIPTALGSLSSLTSLMLSGNHFTIPGEPLLSQINQKTITSDPEWAANQTPDVITPPQPFDCSQVTEIPVGECQALSALYAATNGPGWTNHTGWLDTQTPCSWYAVTCTGGHVTTLSLYSNLLYGTIPPEIANLTALNLLLLAHNQLSGTIPVEIGQMAQLNTLYLAANQLSGPIPPELGSMPSLKYLVLWGNLLSGPVPTELGHLTQLNNLLLGSNQLNGSLPAEVGSLPNLKFADFSTNQFCGSIPSSFGTSATLNDLRLSGNHFFIPAEPLLSQLNAKTPNDRNWTANQTAGECSAGKTLLALYVLAFDNGPQSTASLSGYFTATMQSIATATTARPGVRAVVLSDLSGPDNVAVYEVNNGVVRQVTENLPALTESTVINGTEMGGYLQWARATYPADQVSMYYVGHNKPLPQAGLNESAPANLRISAAQEQLFPLPIRDGAHPDYTDATPTPDVLSVYDLAEALRLASAGGSQPLDLLDLSSCFALSFEETYPLRYATRTIVGSGNYAFFEPALAGAFLQAQQAGMSPRDMAAAVVNAKDATLPASSHPRILTAIDTARMDALKDAWDAVSYNLWLGLNDPVQRQSFKDKLVKAYQYSNKYDCTFCQPQDWALETPDALVDLHSFAAQLRNQFGSTSPVGIAANNAFGILYQLLITRAAHNGIPWFGNPNKTWNFDNSLGLSLYADFVGKDDGQGHILLNDIAPWYTRTVSAYNPHPYEFVQSGAYGQEIQPGGINWADVFTLFWRDNTNLLTQLCLPAFPSIIEQGDLIAGSVVSPARGTTHLGTPVTFSATVRSVNDAHNVQVGFYVVQNHQTVWTTIASVPLIAAGTEVTVTADQTWTPSQTGPFTIYVSVDPNLYFQETTRSNNYTYLNDTVNGSPAYPRPEVDVTLFNAQQWWSTSPIQLVVNQKAETITTEASRVNMLVVEFYQYQPGVNPTTQVPVKVGTQTIAPLTLPQSGLPVSLPASIHPGIVVLHIWPYSDGGGMGSGQVVTFNYTPANIALANQQAQYFSFDAAAGDQIEINLLVTGGSTRMYVWLPGNAWSAQAISDSGTITIDPALAGTYLVCVLGKSDDTQYTLTATRNAIAPMSAASVQSSGSAVTTEVRTRPEFSSPPLFSPSPYQVFLPSITR